MGHKILGGTQANWAISLVDGYYRISKTLQDLAKEEDPSKFILLWAWQTESGLKKIEEALRDSEVYFMTDKSKAEIIGKGKWIKYLGHKDLTSYL